jgi:3-deoxy-D-manno-octulosonate 8-phosphate phosphatase (KDO 8-P phosphatase)
MTPGKREMEKTPARTAGPTASEPDFRCIRLLVLDVDGVLTDGRIILDSEGREVKQFCVRDGSAVKWLIRAGVQVAWLSGRSSPVVARRAQELGVEEVVQGAKQKLPAFRALLRRTGCRAEEVCYLGDDLPDIPVLRQAGLACAVADAPEEVKAVCQVVTRALGGRGAVREVAERILRARGAWNELLARYLRP